MQAHFLDANSYLVLRYEVQLLLGSTKTSITAQD
jgi:hypothetical protein